MSQPNRKQFCNLSERQMYRHLVSQCDEDMFHLEMIGYSYNVLNVPNNQDESDTEETVESFNRSSNNQSLIEDQTVHTEVHIENRADLLDLTYERVQVEFDNNIDNDIDMDDSENSDRENESFNDNVIENVLIEYNFDLRSNLAAWSAECNTPRDHVNKLLKILREAGHAELPNDARSLLKTPRTTEIVLCPPGEYFHYGLEQALTDILSTTTIKENNVIIDINIDGLPISKSTQKSLWPILEKIIDYPSITPFVIGIYHGNAKPNSLDTFLSPFIEEYVKLHEQGFMHNNQHITVTLRCIVCDSPARSYVLGTKQFNGYFGCGKCIEEGDFINRIVFLNENAPLRTDISFRNRYQQEHHIRRSPFETLSIDMISQFPLDYMHLVCLGVTKLLLNMWLHPKRNCKINTRQIQKL